MGCNPSKPLNSLQTDVDQGLPAHYPLAITRPPRYSRNEHNEACRLLRPWTMRGAKSRSFTFVVHVINNSLLDRSQTLAQVRLLGHLQQLAFIHKLQVLVKCLDYLSETNDDPYAANEKQLYLDMLAARSKAATIRLWDDRPPTASTPSPEETTTAEHRISAVIDQVRRNGDLGDVDVKNQVEPELVAALSRFAKSWSLDEFMEMHEKIMGEPPTLNAAGISKLQAQFILQAQVARASLTSDNGATPTISVSFLPDDVPNVTLINIKKQWKTLFVPLAKRVKESEKSLRQDLYTMQLISLGSAHSKGGQQWKELDELGQAGMDIIDHLHLDAGQILLRGPGSLLGQKMLLGSVGPAADRAKAKRESEAGLYGTGGSQVTHEDMDACVCQTQGMVPGVEYVQLSQDA
ncbi:hypothetical protein CORC01_14479 [Colletotrichum orchidophilum]|uniref:Uncharacterized protein n=1 Tax=Colletotrichum orchidophilum TaxID=1209926 RepID=A0A1G4AM33_9PEZI|nr:uncharacterized protein CORC01_14479 [Colletotrichum orchidophilum]OHE90229.1 hypothetical protein CORC01_14479 [Colletotrichum orchidophilum]